MALLSSIKCRVCGQLKQVWHSTVHIPDTCDECISRMAGKERDASLAKLAELTLEQRIARLEAWAYDYEKEHASTLSAAKRSSTRF